MWFCVLPSAIYQEVHDVDLPQCCLTLTRQCLLGVHIVKLLFFCFVINRLLMEDILT